MDVAISKPPNAQRAGGIMFSASCGYASLRAVGNHVSAPAIVAAALLDRRLALHLQSLAGRGGDCKYISFLKAGAAFCAAAASYLKDVALRGYACAYGQAVEVRQFHEILELVFYGFVSFAVGRRGVRQTKTRSPL